MNNPGTARLAALLLSVVSAACGGGGSNNNPDAGHTTDAPNHALDARPTTDASSTTDSGSTIDTGITLIDAASTCTPIAAAFGTQDIISHNASNSVILWGGPVTTDLGDGGAASFAIEFYDDMMTNTVGSIDLATGKQADYATCVECVRVFTNDAMGASVRQYYQSGGTLTLTANPFTTKTMVGTITNLTLVEVTIDPNTFTSTLVPGGKCLAVGDVTLNADAIPNAWTCANAKYSDGVTCDCMCGAPDPDCGIAMAPVAGCTTGQVCSNAVCVTPPTNDTCQAAIALTIGTPTTGSTVGAANNYSSGLETATCDTLAQPGEDVTFSVALAAGTSYTFALSNVSASFDASLALLGPGMAAAVCDASPVACLKGSDAGFAGDPETFQFTPTTAGTYFLIVDSYHTGSPGSFTVTVSTP